MKDLAYTSNEISKEFGLENKKLFCCLYNEDGCNFTQTLFEYKDIKV